MLEQVVADYNVRNNAAIAAAGHYDPSLWKTADTGAMLDWDLFDTRYKEVFNQPAEAGDLLYQPLQQYGAAPEKLPEVGRRDGDDGAQPHHGTDRATFGGRVVGTPSNEPDVDVAVFEQAADGAPWLMSMNAATRRADLPAEATGQQRRWSNSRPRQLSASSSPSG